MPSCITKMDKLMKLKSTTVHCRDAMRSAVYDDVCSVSFKQCCSVFPSSLCKTVDLGSHASRWDPQHTNKG